MNVIYIGQYEPGSTSRMRGEHLSRLLPVKKFSVADISIPIQQTGKLFRSAGWRFYRGPLINNINSYCEQIIDPATHYDLVWVDKGVFIQPSLLKKLKAQKATIIHYTPDTAFAYNRSHLFFSGLLTYDFCITTKSFELEAYKSHGAHEVFFCTQGYDPAIHRPVKTPKAKEGIGFVGLCEPFREEVAAKLLEEGIVVKIAGSGWEHFVRKHHHNANLQYAGKFLAGAAYAAFYSGCQAGLGLVSKKFPELHTTRHFEIPACGTALVTERNAETTRFFAEDDVIFFSDIKELVDRVRLALSDKEYLNTVSTKGYQKVTKGGYDYESILRTLAQKTGLLA